MLKFLSSKITSLLRKTSTPFDLEKIEEIFYSADFGSSLTEEIMQLIKELIQKKQSYEQIQTAIHDFLLRIILEVPTNSSFLNKQDFQTFLIVGSNGTGKTTTIAKLAHFFLNKKKKVLVVSTDIFRAAAQEQLIFWSKKLNCDFIQAKKNQDPAAVAFDSIQKGLNEKYDILLIDTSGRLHTNFNLMKELEKIRRVCGKAEQNSPHETIMIIDGTFGQNIIDQVKTFHKSTPITQCILTKMDGTAKGGTIFNIYKNLSLPVSFIGYGEDIQSLKLFNPQAFIKEILPLNL